MAGKTTDLVCLTPPPALKHAPTVSHAYLAMQIDRDANGEFHLPPFDPFLLQGQVIDVSIFTNQDARACFEGMISGNASLKQSWDKILAAVDYFKGQGNSDGKPDIISWGELVAGYQGRDQELRNAFINIKSASRILQERSMDDGLASFRAQMRRGMVLEAKGKLKEAL
ncbi:MAG: hypothetical protein Q7S98_01455, partial [Deltaproteobacteria bacterium]|nr:hypothetical protein [Deltaproteobacteria bacterium]